jgi:putative heme iron utilization protein
MIQITNARVAAAMALSVGGLLVTAQAIAEGFCATPDQASQIRAFYKDNPGTMPVIAARRLNLPEATVVSGLPADQSAGIKGEAFMEVWGAMNQWKEATFLIMKGENVFEVASSVGTATPSKTSKYTNIAYEQPLRGHLRPDLYTSIYAVALPGKEGAVPRGVLFYDASGASVFGAFISGDGPPPPASELAKFDAVMALVKSKPALCGGAPS